MTIGRFPSKDGKQLYVTADRPRGELERFYASTKASCPISAVSPRKTWRIRRKGSGWPMLPSRTACSGEAKWTEAKSSTQLGPRLRP